MSTECDSLRSEGCGLKCDLFLLVEAHAPPPEPWALRRTVCDRRGVSMRGVPSEEFVHDLRDVSLLHRSQPVWRR